MKNELTWDEAVALMVWLGTAGAMLLVMTVSVAQVDALNLRWELHVI